jgi:hypothetical protein
MNSKPKLNVFSRSPVFIGVLGLIVVVAGWLFLTVDTPLRLPPDLTSATAVPEVSPKRLSDGAGDWSALPGLATFGNDFKLLAFTLPSTRLSPGDIAEITLYWQKRATTTTYSLFLHVFDADNQLVSQVDAPLVNSNCAAASQFSSGIVVTCDSILLPEGLTPGSYQLAAGVYEPDSGRRLTTPKGESVVPLMTIEIEPVSSTLDPTLSAPCPVTVPNGSTPPGEQPSPDQHGNGQIWTGLWPEGKVTFEPDGPGQILPDGSLAMKWWWWRGVEGQLTIKGRRLDAPAPPLQADIPEGYGETGFQAAGLIFPSEGCWEVTGKVGEAELTFVTLVVKAPENQ